MGVDCNAPFKNGADAYEAKHFRLSQFATRDRGVISPPEEV